MPGRSCGMEKKDKRKRASSIGSCDADAGFAAVGVARRVPEAAVERVVGKRQKSRVRELISDKQVDCSPERRDSAGQLYQELCTVEDRCNGDDSVSAAACAETSGGVREPKVVDSAPFISRSCTSGKAKRRRIKDELCWLNGRNGQVEEESGPSSSPDELTRRKLVEKDAGKGEEIEQHLKEEQISKRPEEDRVWQYVCKRAVFISPPVPARKTEEQNIWHSFRRERGSYLASNGQSVDDSLSVDKTNVIDLTFDRDVVKVTLTRESREVRKWIERQSVRRFGLDVEWQPNTFKGRKENKVSLLQLSTVSECLLVQMLYLDSIPDELVQLLKDPNRLFAGVGIRNDAKKLERDHGLVCKGEIELTTLAVAHFKDQELKRAGLKALAKKVLQFDICKSKRITMSNWARLHLSRSQIEYASLDAWVSLAIYSELDRVSRVVAG